MSCARHCRIRFCRCEGGAALGGAPGADVQLIGGRNRRPTCGRAASRRASLGTGQKGSWPMGDLVFFATVFALVRAYARFIRTSGTSAMLSSSTSLRAAGLLLLIVAMLTGPAENPGSTLEREQTRGALRGRRGAAWTANQGTTRRASRRCDRWGWGSPVWESPGRGGGHTHTRGQALTPRDSDHEDTHTHHPLESAPGIGPRIPGLPNHLLESTPGIGPLTPGSLGGLLELTPVARRLTARVREMKTTCPPFEG